MPLALIGPKSALAFLTAKKTHGTSQNTQFPWVDATRSATE